jgi:hypothetical protein
MAKGTAAGKTTAPEGEEDLPIDIADLLEQFSSAGTVMLYRRPSPMEEEEYLGSFPVLGFEQDLVRDIYGGGRYRFQLREVGTGKVLKGTSRKFRIGGPSKYPDSAAAKETAAANPPALEKILEILTQRERPAEKDPVQQLRETLGVLKDLGMAPQAGTQLPAAEIAATFREGMKLQREMLTGRSDDDDDRPRAGPYDGVVEAFGKPFGKLVESVIANRQQPIALPPAPPRATESAELPALAPSTVTPPPQTETMIGLARLQAWIPKIQKWAAARKDSYIRAQLILEEQDDETRKAMLDALRDDAVLEQVVGFIPLPNEEQREWCRDLLRDVRDVLEQEVEEREKEIRPRVEAAGTTAAEGDGIEEDP